MNILHLNLKKKWFDMIASGEKKEEYREIKPYWNKRLDKEYTHILFRNGYQKNAPELFVKLKGIKTDFGHDKWGAPKDPCYCLMLGEIK